MQPNIIFLYLADHPCPGVNKGNIMDSKKTRVSPLVSEAIVWTRRQKRKRLTESKTLTKANLYVVYYQILYKMLFKDNQTNQRNVQHVMSVYHFIYKMRILV